MTSLRLNTSANLVGTAFVALVYLLILPIYLRLLGADAFGVVGLFFSLAAIFAVFDFGFGASLSRHMAQLSALEGGRLRQRNALRTYECVVWAMCFLLGIILFFMLPKLVEYWLKTGSLDTNELKTAFRWMALGLALQMVLSLYTHALWGLQQQFIFNIINASMISLRLIGAAAMISFVHDSLVSFFVWQTLITAVHAGAFAWASWRYVPGTGPPVFDADLLKHSKIFIFEVALATLFATLLMHIDKIVLSKLISLKEYGYYMLAWSIASVLGRIAGPVYSAWVPRLTQHVAAANSSQLKSTYLSGLKFLAVLIVPSVLILAVFAESILRIYTGNTELAKAGAMALLLLSIGSACNGILLMPHAMALAHGWTRLSLVQNALACLFALPLVYLATKTWGLDGAGIGWLLVNAVLLALTVPIIHRRCMSVPMTK